MKSRKHISNPSETLWNLFGKPLDVDATKLVEESWTNPNLGQKRSRKTKKKATD
jgi:hypothetical protein